MSFPAPVSDSSNSTSSEQHESLEELLFSVGMKNRDLLRRSLSDSSVSRKNTGSSDLRSGGGGDRSRDQHLICIPSI